MATLPNMYQILLKCPKNKDLLPMLSQCRLYAYSVTSRALAKRQFLVASAHLLFKKYQYVTISDRLKGEKIKNENVFSLCRRIERKLFLNSPKYLDENNVKNVIEGEYSEIYNDVDYEKWSREILPVAGRHSVLVIQPYIKWGNAKKTNTNPDLQLAEAVALIESLYSWKVVDKMTLGLKSFEKKTFFGSGNFDALRQKVNKQRNITAVFISTKMLRGIQHREIEKEFGVPVFDRYTIVIQLFRQHAVSSEAKLQIAMAEIPYMWSRLKGVTEGFPDRRGGSGGQTGYEIHKSMLVHRENKIKRALNKLRSHRQLLRSKRNKLEYPIVAVVGYTNAGKTSLIKALTGDETLQPENRLFATLDVSNHMGTLPCRLKVLYVDTVGFISDIPTNLLESFVATLEDALLADVILHVKDISHPDYMAQSENVLDTLRGLHLSSDMLENIIVAGNKQDLVNSDLETRSDIGIPVSAVTHSGIDDLKKKIEECILRVTGRVSLVISVPQGGEEASWLYKEATVTEIEADPKNSQRLLMHTILTHAQLGKFQHYFIDQN